MERQEDMIDFEPPQQQANELGDFTDLVKSNIASLNARAVMPDGGMMDRAQILQRLGLNPGTSPTAWLAIVACGSNASALLPNDLQRVSVNRIANASAVLGRVKGLTEGFAPGGRSTIK
jgi:hypothetical protein